MDEIYVECGAEIDNAEIKFTRKHYFKVNETDSFRKKYKNKNVYETMMEYINPEWAINEYGKKVIDTKTCLKQSDFYLDFDYPLEKEEDFAIIKEDVFKAIKYINKILNINSDNIDLFFSGNKGIHLTVKKEALGIKPHIELNKIFKQIAEDISSYCSNNTLDTRIYDDKRMFRMNNSFNGKGNKYKIPITIEELKNLSLSEIKELAEKERVIKKQNKINTNINFTSSTIDQYVKKWNEKKIKKEFKGSPKKLEKLPICIETMLEKTFRETIDERNNSAAALASFYMQQELDLEDTMSKLKSWNENQCIPSLDDIEIENVVKSIYTRSYKYGCETFKRVSGVCDKDKCPLFCK